MRKFTKYFVCFVLMVVYAPFVIAGFVGHEIMQAFITGIDLSKASTRTFGDWLSND